MDKELIRQLMSGERKKVIGRRYYITRAGNKENLGGDITAIVGGFEGKQGTYRRSRKGASRIQPNGSRYYVPGSEDCVAYKV